MTYPQAAAFIASKGVLSLYAFRLAFSFCFQSPSDFIRRSIPKFGPIKITVLLYSGVDGYFGGPVR